MTLGGPALGMAVDVFDDDGQPVRGAVGELVCTQPVAGHDARPVERPRALPRDVLEPLARRVGARRLGARSTTTASGTCTAAATTPSRSPASGSGRPRSSRRSWPIPRSSRPRRSACPTRSRARRSGRYVVLAPGVEPADELRAELRDLVADQLGKSFKPAAIRFTAPLPKTRNAKVLRRAIRATALGTDPGDLSSLEDPATLDRGECAT